MMERARREERVNFKTGMISGGGKGLREKAKIGDGLYLNHLGRD